MAAGSGISVVRREIDVHVVENVLKHICRYLERERLSCFVCDVLSCKKSVFNICLLLKKCFAR